MKRNITLSADDALIRQARCRASAENTSLNELFRNWLSWYVAQPPAADEFGLLMARLDHVCCGRGFTREELNERG